MISSSRPIVPPLNDPGSIINNPQNLQNSTPIPHTWNDQLPTSSTSFMPRQDQLHNANMMMYMNHYRGGDYRGVGGYYGMMNNNPMGVGVGVGVPLPPQGHYLPVMGGYGNGFGSGGPGMNGGGGGGYQYGMQVSNIPSMADMHAIHNYHLTQAQQGNVGGKNHLLRINDTWNSLI